MVSEAATTKESFKEEEGHFIVSPLFDFAMVGGLSVVIFLLVFLPIWSDATKDNIGYFAFIATFFLTYQHFTHSYQLLYNNYIHNLTDKKSSIVTRIRYLIAGIVAPLLLIAALIYSAVQPTREELSTLVNVMLFLTGWHYVKQGYGVMIVLSVREKVFFNNLEKKVLLINAYIVWLFAWIYFNWSNRGDNFYGIPYKNFEISDNFMMIAKIIMVVWSMGVVLFCVKRADHHKKLSYNGLVAYIGPVYIWVLLFPFYPILYLLAPLFHSMQYNFMVLKLTYEKQKTKMNEYSNDRNIIVWKKMLPFIAISLTGVTLLGYFFPLWLDSFVTYNKAEFGPYLFLFSFMIFVNIHHYFIDFAIWRRENSEMSYLFK